MRVPPGRLIRPDEAFRRHVPGSRRQRSAAADIFELKPCGTTLYGSQPGGAEARYAASCGTRSGETPHEKQKKYPRRPAATITTLTAATGKVLTEFVGFRPTDLGHLKFRPRRKERQRCGSRTESAYTPALTVDFRTLGSIPPRTLDVLQLNGSTRHYSYRNGIEPIGSCIKIAPCDPGAGGKGNRPALFPGNGLQGMAECGPTASLHFHKRDEPILLHHEVDFLTEKANVAVEHSPTPLFQEGFGQCFKATSATYGIQE